MDHAIFGQPEGYNGRKYRKAGKNKRENDIKAYVKTGMFHRIKDSKVIELIKMIGWLSKIDGVSSSGL